MRHEAERKTEKEWATKAKYTDLEWSREIDIAGYYIWFECFRRFAHIESHIHSFIPFIHIALGWFRVSVIRTEHIWYRCGGAFSSFSHSFGRSLVVVHVDAFGVRRAWAIHLHRSANRIALLNSNNIVTCILTLICYRNIRWLWTVECAKIDKHTDSERDVGKKIIAHTKASHRCMNWKGAKQIRKEALTGAILAHWHISTNWLYYSLFLFSIAFFFGCVFHFFFFGSFSFASFLVLLHPACV